MRIRKVTASASSTRVTAEEVAQRTAQSIGAEHGSTIGILLLSQYVEAARALDLFADGTSGLGYLIKERVLDPTELTDAPRRVADGGSAIDPIVVEQLLKGRSTDGILDTLTAS